MATCSVHLHRTLQHEDRIKQALLCRFGRSNLILRPDSPRCWSPARPTLSFLLSHPDPASPGQGKALLFTRARRRPSHKDSRQMDPAARMLTGWGDLRSRLYLPGCRAAPPQSSTSAERGTRSRPPTQPRRGSLAKSCPIAPEPLAAWRRGRRRSLAACGAAA